VGTPDSEWAPGGQLGTFRLSPDETKIAYAPVQIEKGRTNQEVWQLDLGRHVRDRLTFAPGPDLVPVWSPDGRQVVYASNRDEATGFDAYVMTEGSERALAKLPGNGWPLDWSPDGRVILQLQGNAVWSVPSDGSAPTQYLAASVGIARFSPNGRWVAYVSNESGQQNEIWVRPFPGPGPAKRVSVAGGTEPQWRREGSELFYVAPDGTLMAVPVTSDVTAIQFGRPVPLFASAAGYQAARDGQRFLVARRPTSSEVAITIVLNWQSSIDR
jgi:Tol biopolymer transport system component